MDKILSLTEELVKTIKDSDVYNTYITSLNEINEQPLLKFKIDHYKTLRFQFEEKRMNGESSFSDELSLSNFQSDLMLNQLTATFLNSEKAVVTMLTNIYSALGNAIKIDLDFLDME